jgi:hypothetical protein
MGGGHGRLNSDAAAAILLAVLLGNLAISASCNHTMHFMASVCESLACLVANSPVINSCVCSWKARRGSCCRVLPEEGTAAAAAGRRQDDGDGSKIYLIFCQRSKCVDDDREFTCYCCLHWKSACWKTMKPAGASARCATPSATRRCRRRYAALGAQWWRRLPAFMSGCASL